MTKLADANNASTKYAKVCTLILTEGVTAKTLAVTGLGVIGHDNFCVFPLRGAKQSRISTRFWVCNTIRIIPARAP